MRLIDHSLVLVIPVPMDRPWPSTVPAGWREMAVEGMEAFLVHLRQKYHAHFLATMHPSAVNGPTDRVGCYVPMDRQQLMIGAVGVVISAIELRAFGPGVGMVTIFIDLDREKATLDELDRTAGAVREPMTAVVGEGGGRPWIEHLAALLSPWSVASDRLLHFGPNFKVFVNAVVDVDRLDDTSWDDHLFELATGLPQGGMHEPQAPTVTYRSDQVARHGIKVFRNWRALALFDTFTRLAVRSEDPYRSWERDYLRIFQYVLLLRTQAMALSERLARTALNDVALLDLRDRWLAFRNEIDLAFVSFKWLPNELFERMVAGTNTMHEIHRADERLQRMVQRFKERRARNLTRVALVMLGLIIVLLFAFSDLV